MPDNNLNITLRVAQSLLGHLAEPINSELKDLLERAETEKGIPIAINRLLYKHNNIRLWMDEQISIQSKTKGAESHGFSSISGNPNLVSASQRWVCPKNPHEHWIFVIQEGEDPPTCKEHRCEMVRAG